MGRRLMRDKYGVPIRYAAPTYEALMLLRDVAPVTELGAGDGFWLVRMRTAGIDCVGYDLEPQCEPVQRGDINAVKKHVGTMLAVWPPDSDEIQSWIKGWRGSHIAVCADHARLEYGDALNDWELIKTLEMPSGCKGFSKLCLWARKGLVGK
jgi:hypothetical protein